MKGFDAPRGKLKGLALRGGDLGRRGKALAIAETQAADIGVDAVELARVLEQRRIAACTHVGHDVGHNAVDVLVAVAIAVEERCERLLETGRRGVQSSRRHG